MTADPGRALHVAMFAPWHERCGTVTTRPSCCAPWRACRKSEAPGGERALGCRPARHGRRTARTIAGTRRGSAFSAVDAMNAGATWRTCRAPVLPVRRVRSRTGPHPARFSELSHPPCRLARHDGAHEIAAESGGGLSRLTAPHGRKPAELSLPPRAGRSGRSSFRVTEDDPTALQRTWRPQTGASTSSAIPFRPRFHPPEPSELATGSEPAHPELAGCQVLSLPLGFFQQKGPSEALAALALLPDDLALVFAGTGIPTATDHQ